MSPIVPRIDPVIAELLREIAADPRSRIFGRTAERAREAQTRSDVLSPRAAGLQQAERHLLSVHRSEVAYLLRAAFCESFAQAPAAERAYTRRFELEARAARESRARRELEHAREPREPRDPGNAALERLLDDAGEPLDAGVLAVLALRLECCDPARIYCAADLERQGERRAASEILRRVLAGHPREVDAWCAWRNLGFNQFALGLPEEAYTCYQRAAEIGGDKADLWAYTFVLAVRIGAIAGARRAAARVDELADNPSWAESFRLDAGAHGFLDPGPESRATLARLRPDLGPISTEIAHAFPS